jgi:hypothetical protein
MGYNYHPRNFLDTGFGYPLPWCANQYPYCSCLNSGDCLVGAARQNQKIKNLKKYSLQERRAKNMPRKTRSDKTVGNVEKDLGLSTGAIRNENGRDTRSDKKLGTIRKEQGK